MYFNDGASSLVEFLEKQYVKCTKIFNARNRYIVYKAVEKTINSCLEISTNYITGLFANLIGRKLGERSR